MKTLVKQLLKPVLISIASSVGPRGRRGKAGRLWLLMYHRVLPRSSGLYQQEEPGMVVCPETLEMHFREIRQHFDIVRLSDWVMASQAGEVLPPRCCAITFDDGWLDNYEYAFPVVKAQAVPITLFAVAEKIGSDFQFWPNIIAALLSSGSASTLARHPLLGVYVPEMAKPPSSDELAAIINRLKSISDKAIMDALEDLNWRSLCDKTMPPALMDWNQLSEMQRSGLVDVGSHTCTHRRLTNTLTVSELEHEIVYSKELLERNLQVPVNLFCFPNGDYNALALSMVKQHYLASVTTRRGINDSDGVNVHEMVRIGLHDEISCSRRLFRARLTGWI